MSDIAIRIARVSKRYRLEGLARGRDTLRSRLGRALAGLRRRRSADTGVFWALRDVSFDIERGTVTSIVGRNGAGKSTLLRILARVTEPTSGRIEIYGQISSLLDIGTGFQPDLTGRENVLLNASILGMRRTEVERRFDEIVAFAGVERFIDVPLKRYSTGMYMRLAFAIAAHLEPEILFVDEVLAVGDAGFQRRCLDRLRTVAAEGRTVVFVGHDLGAVAELSDRCVLLEDGRLRHIGPTPEVLETYRRSFEPPAPPAPAAAAAEGLPAPPGLEPDGAPLPLVAGMAATGRLP
jgi:lipopolysaccharide transport system ATP-binding protein